MATTPDVPATSGSSVLLVEHDGFTELRFNRPQRMNALDGEMARAFRDAVGVAVSLQGSRAIFLSAEGRSFMAGGDLGYLSSAEDRCEAAMDILGPMNEALVALAETPQIVVSSLKGPVAGAGMSIALGTDLAIASSDTTFRLAYSRIGASPDCGGSWALPRLVGLRRAMEIALFSDAIDASGARDLGLVNFVVDGDSLAEETLKLARRLAEGPAIAQGATKALLRKAQAASLREQLAAEAEHFVTCARSQEFAEGVDAFFAKRAPRYRMDLEG